MQWYFSCLLRDMGYTYPRGFSKKKKSARATRFLAYENYLMSVKHPKENEWGKRWNNENRRTDVKIKKK